MAYNTYFGSKPVSDWTANGSAESGHNFIDQINEQKGNVAGAEQKYNTAAGGISGAQSAYDEAYKNQQNYSNLYGQAKGSEGVNEAQAQYQKSLASANATQAAMNTLPSSINAGSNVVLTQAQRNAALGNQMKKYENTLDYWTRQNQGDLSSYQTALASAQDVAKTNMGQEQAKVNQAMTNLQTRMDYANQLYNQILQERQIMRSIYGDMYEDEYRHMQQEIEAWAQNLKAETDRYKADVAAKANNYASDINKYLNSGYTWNGNEWVNNNLVQPTIESYIDVASGSMYTPQTDKTPVEPIVQYYDNGKNGYTRNEVYIPSANQLADLVYGGY